MNSLNYWHKFLFHCFISGIFFFLDTIIDSNL